MLVEVPSIINSAHLESQLTSFVIISHGVTQWARWQKNTGDPYEGGFHPFETSANSAGGDPGVRKGDPDTKDEVKTQYICHPWQTPCLTVHEIPLSERSWHSLPAKKEGRLSWISRTAAQILRHENLHATDGSVVFSNFYKAMTDEMWRTVGNGCVQFISSPQLMIQSIIRGSDRIRYQICWQRETSAVPDLMSGAFASSSLSPIYIRAVQGHSGKTKVDLSLMKAWEVTTEHTYILFHAGWRHNMDSILRNGLLAGGATEKPGRRQHCYFSIRDPRVAAPGDQSTTYYPTDRDKEEIATGITTRAYPIHDKALDAMYQIDLRRAKELGLHFYQTPSLAVLCDSNIPPECIIKITDMPGQVLYRNEHLLACAPGDRPAYIMKGTDIANARLFFKAPVGPFDTPVGPFTWEDCKMQLDKSDRDAMFMKQYCCAFHNERICTRCHTFNFKGLIHCVVCGAAEQSDVSHATGSFVSVRDQIEFTNAELKTLVYKQNFKYRGKLTGEYAILKARARKHLKRALKGTLQLDGTYRKFTSVLDRWDNDEYYRTTLINKEDLSREDAAYYDQLASMPTEEKKMAWEERKDRMQKYEWEVVQAKGGGGQTVPTKLYPTYAAKIEAKASPTPAHPASSSSSWQGQDWWSQSSRQTDWQWQDWSQSKW